MDHYELRKTDTFMRGKGRKHYFQRFGKEHSVHLIRVSEFNYWKENRNSFFLEMPFESFSLEKVQKVSYYLEQCGKKWKKGREKGITEFLGDSIFLKIFFYFCYS